MVRVRRLNSRKAIFFGHMPDLIAVVGQIMERMKMNIFPDKTLIHGSNRLNPGNKNTR